MVLLMNAMLTEEGVKSGIVAFAKDRGEFLPPGWWKICYPDGLEELMDVDHMPPHWQEQLHRAGEFGKTLD